MKNATIIVEDLPDEERQAYTKLAQGCMALVKLHNVEERELAKYLMQYTTIKEITK